MDDFPAPNSSDLVDLGHGVSVAWLEDGAILNFQLDATERDAIDVWIDDIHGGVSLMPSDAPVLLLHELPQPQRRNC